MMNKAKAKEIYRSEKKNRGKINEVNGSSKLSEKNLS